MVGVEFGSEFPCRLCGFFKVGKPAPLVNLPVPYDLYLEAASRVLVDVPMSRVVEFIHSQILHLLTPCNEPKVSSAVVQRIPVNMIDFKTVRSIHDKTVEQNRFFPSWGGVDVSVGR